MEEREREIRRLLEDALQRYGDGDVARATAAWHQVLSLDPNNLQAREYLHLLSRDAPTLAGSTAATSGADARPPQETPASQPDAQQDWSASLCVSWADAVAEPPDADEPLIGEPAPEPSPDERSTDELRVNPDAEALSVEGPAPPAPEAEAPPLAALTPPDIDGTTVSLPPERGEDPIALDEPRGSPEDYSGEFGETPVTGWEVQEPPALAPPAAPPQTRPKGGWQDMRVSELKLADQILDDWARALEDERLTSASPLLTSAPAPIELPPDAGLDLTTDPPPPQELVAGPWDEGPTASLAIELDNTPIESGEYLAPVSGVYDLDELNKQLSEHVTDTDTPVAAAGAPGPDHEAEQEGEIGQLLRGARDLFNLGDFTGSLELINKVLAKDPHNLEAHSYLEKNQATLLSMYESKIGSFDRVPRVVVSPDEIIWLNLHHRAGFVLSQIDGMMTYDDLLSLSGMSRLETCQILVQLLGAGVIEAS